MKIPRHLVAMTAALFVLTSCAELAGSSGPARPQLELTTTRIWILSTQPYKGPVPLELEAIVSHSQTVSPSAPFKYGDGLGSGLRFVLRNTTDRFLTVLWDQSTFVDEKLRPRRLVRAVDGPRAVRSAQMPTTVPPGAELQQEVYPDDCFGFKRHVTTKMFLPAERTDAEFQLVIAVTIGDGVVPVSQTFRVSEVRVEQERQVRGDEP